ncbi:hypothetical protein [Polaribacter sp. Hel1_85]|uniref:hypothetical protein n=1 Tax=Polaribacter sp. Hel1_85 TaxID=1250005 RepID=UPI00052BF34D|nr:hypothetical protein [Polaribacter sp. Hel1_85]KGL62831.1 hypothetical protein PHEL85_2627 [Polaribacter sp. Hel1_85]
MKTFKKILIVMIAMVTIASCQVTDEDTVAEVASEAGMIINVVTTPTSSILGSPEGGVDLKDAKVNITNAYLDLTVRLSSGNLDNISKIEVVKSFNGGAEVSLGESTTLPYNIVISNLTDLLADTGVVESDLRIGDDLSFKTKVHKKDGSVFYYSTSLGDYSLVVNCSSNLAAAYSISLSSGVYTCTVTEVSPGVYYADRVPFFSNAYWFEFTDTCGVLKMTDFQYNPGNQLEGFGYVAANGDLVWESVSVGGTSVDGWDIVMPRLP